MLCHVTGMKRYHPAPIALYRSSRMRYPVRLIGFSVLYFLHFFGCKFSLAGKTFPVVCEIIPAFCMGFFDPFRMAGVTAVVLQADVAVVVAIKTFFQHLKKPR